MTKHCYHDFEGRKIVVTGASSGIGKAIALALAMSGAKVALVARDKMKLESVIAELNGKGHTYIAVDLEKMIDLSDGFNKIVEDGCKLNGLVHCAGMAQVLPLNMLTRERVEKEMAINYYAFIELCRQYAKSKHSDGGSIVGISSIAADRAEKGQTNYAASKAAMDHAAQALAIELAPKGIRVNTILPGVTITPMTNNANIKGAVDVETITKGQLLGAAQPEDIANIALFLLSDASRMITGRRIFADGGRLI